MTYEEAFDFLRIREASVSFVYVPAVEKLVATISYMSDTIKAQGEDLIAAIETCSRRERELIAANKITDRTPIQARIIEWHKSRESSPMKVIE